MEELKKTYVPSRHFSSFRCRDPDACCPYHSHATFYPEGGKPSSEGTYTRIVSPQAFHRIKDLLDRTKGTVVLGGESDEATKFIAPTVVKNVGGDDSLMSEYVCVLLLSSSLAHHAPFSSFDREIFGPVLPIIPVDNVDEAIAFINAR